MGEVAWGELAGSGLAGSEIIGKYDETTLFPDNVIMKDGNITVLDELASDHPLIKLLVSNPHYSYGAFQDDNNNIILPILDKHGTVRPSGKPCLYVGKPLTSIPLSLRKFETILPVEMSGIILEGIRILASSS